MNGYLSITSSVVLYCKRISVQGEVSISVRMRGYRPKSNRLVIRKLKASKFSDSRVTTCTVTTEGGGGSVRCETDSIKCTGTWVIYNKDKHLNQDKQGVAATARRDNLIYYITKRISQSN